MKRIARLAAAQRGSASAYHLGLVRNAAWLDIAKYALASAGFALSAGLIVVASGAEIRIGAARHEEFPAIASVRPWLEPDLPDVPTGTDAERLDNAPMLIAEDPGPEIWTRLVSGEELPHPAEDVLIRPTNFTLQPVKIQSLALKAIATQQWPADLFAGASVFTGPLLAHAAADDRAAPAVSIPPAVVAQGNDKSPAPSDKTESPAATPTKDPTPPQPAPAQSAPAQVAPIPPLSSFVPPPEQITPPKDPPKQDPPPAPPLDQGGSGPVSSVPEPNGWACLLMGFGVIGATLRRARSRAGSARRDVISPPAA